jgi:CRP-like cAMP-binding protein
VAHKFIEILSNALKEKEVQMLHLAYNSVRQRVAEALLNLKNQSDKEVLSIPRDDLASIVGTAQESVIRTLSDFKEESLIEINSGKISFIN